MVSSSEQSEEEDTKQPRVSNGGNIDKSSSSQLMSFNIPAGAISNIVQVLESGKTMEARENAATTIFSLSMMDDFKVAIGAHPRAIPALVGLLREGTTTGKRDAATAIFNLAVYNANKANIVIAGAVPLLIELLMDYKAGAVLVPLLIDLLRFGSAKGRRTLLHFCWDCTKEN